MAYKINNTFGTLLVILADGTIDTATTDLTLFGKGYAGFGEKLNENLVKLLENSAGTSAPSSPAAIKSPAADKTPAVSPVCCIRHHNSSTADCRVA